jgi:hypothetical protein
MNAEPTDWVDSEGRAVGDCSVFAEEYDFGNNLSSGFLPPTVKIVLCNNAAFMLQ